MVASAAALSASCRRCAAPSGAWIRSLSRMRSVASERPAFPRSSSRGFTSRTSARIGARASSLFFAASTPSRLPAAFGSPRSNRWRRAQSWSTSSQRPAPSCRTSICRCSRAATPSSGGCAAGSPRRVTAPLRFGPHAPTRDSTGDGPDRRISGREPRRVRRDRTVSSRSSRSPASTSSRSRPGAARAAPGSTGSTRSRAPTSPVARHASGGSARKRPGFSAGPRTGPWPTPSSSGEAWS